MESLFKTLIYWLLCGFNVSTMVALNTSSKYFHIGQFSVHSLFTGTRWILTFEKAALRTFWDFMLFQNENKERNLMQSSLGFWGHAIRSPHPSIFVETCYLKHSEPCSYNGLTLRPVKKMASLYSQLQQNKIFYTIQVNITIVDSCIVGLFVLLRFVPI